MSTRKEREGLLKLTEFFPPVMGGESQNGAGAENGHHLASEGRHKHPPQSEGKSPDIGKPLPSAFNSPVKQKWRLGEEGDVQDDMGAEGEEMEETALYTQQLDEIPTTG